MAYFAENCQCCTVHCLASCIEYPLYWCTVESAVFVPGTSECGECLWTEFESRKYKIRFTQNKHENKNTLLAQFGKRLLIENVWYT